MRMAKARQLTRDPIHGSTFIGLSSRHRQVSEPTWRTGGNLERIDVTEVARGDPDRAVAGLAADGVLGTPYILIGRGMSSGVLHA
jgi:hypothetical protein